MAAEADEKGMTRTAPGWALGVAAALVAAQALFFAVWIWRETSGREKGVIRVAVAPVDPRDFIRGQYLDLAYDFERPANYSAMSGDGLDDFRRGDAVYAVLVENAGTGLFEPFVYAPTVSEAKMRADRNAYGAETFEALARKEKAAMLAGRVAGSGFEFGGNRLFVPEGTAEPSTAGTVAILSVNQDMRPRVIGLEIDGKRWKPERYDHAGFR